MQAEDAEDIIKRITGHKGVKALIVINRDGLLLKTNMEVNTATEQLIKNIHDLAIAARRVVREVDPCDDLVFLRTKSCSDEILISPDVNFTVVVIQDRCDQTTCMRSMPGSLA